MRGVKLREAYQFYRMLPQPKPNDNVIYEKRWAIEVKK